MKTVERIQIGQLPVDVVDLNGALDVIDELVANGGGTVFTPNVDHVVVAEQNARFRAAYSRASLSLVDGMPVLWAARLLGQPLPMKVSGSDLIEPLMQRAAQRGYRVYLFGGDDGVAEKARDVLIQKFPGLNIVGWDNPRINVDAISDELLAKIRATNPQLVLVALGAPKQELFCAEQREKLAPAVLLGIGASLDFVAGIRKRAPRWMSRMGLEWLFRLAQEPRRLAHRYLVRDPQFLWVLGKQIAGK
ncbi:MAG TPA: WecB/TagA/CpsF family glycosyltransferase [Polyangiaceae bacterium]|nr:WecB/TagA/CpsF family glycosyltransferase [Polyangiaceae bacterium]